MSLKSDLIAVLFSDAARWVNFMHAGRGIAPITLYHLAAAVQNGTVKTKVDASRGQGRIAFYDPAINTIIATEYGFGSNYKDEKALLIHESAHAILDVIYKGKNFLGKKASMKVLDDEVIGYLAGAFYLVAANAAGASKGAEHEAIKLAKTKVNTKVAWTGCETATFTPAELQPLRNAIKADAKYQDWNTAAVHNG